MKKFFKIIVGVVAATLLALLIVPAFLPKVTTLERSIEIQAPQTQVFAYLSDFNRFREWNPFLENEPNAQVEVKGSGVGSTYRWKGEKSGAGQMTMTQLEAPAAIHIKMDFYDPMSGEAVVLWKVEPNASNGSKVTWWYQQPLPYLNRIFGLIMDKMMGPIFDKGLQNLKKKLEQAP